MKAPAAPLVKDEKFVATGKRRNASKERGTSQFGHHTGMPDRISRQEYDIDDTDDVMKELVKNYEQLTNRSDVKSYLALKNIRLRHPLF